MRTPCSARDRSHPVMSARVAGEVTSRSICSDQSAVPNEVQTRSGLPVSSIVTVENGASGLRRKIRATSASAGSPPGQTLSSVTNRSADGDRRPWRSKSRNSALWREMWLIITSSSTSWRSAIRACPPRSRTAGRSRGRSAARSRDHPTTGTAAGRGRPGTTRPAARRAGRPAIARSPPSESG